MEEMSRQTLASSMEQTKEKAPARTGACGLVFFGSVYSVRLEAIVTDVMPDSLRHCADPSESSLCCLVVFKPYSVLGIFTAQTLSKVVFRYVYRHAHNPLLKIGDVLVPKVVS